MSIIAGWITGVVLASAALAADRLMSGRGAIRLLRSLRQPALSLPAPIHFALKFIWFVVLAFGVEFLAPLSSAPGMIAAIGLMAVLVAWSGIFFRLKAANLAAAFAACSAILFLLFAWITFALDALFALLLLAYAIYLVYLASWSHAVFRINRAAFSDSPRRAPPATETRKS